MRSHRPLVFVSMIAVALAACSASGASTAPTQPVAVATLTATSVPEATSSPAAASPAATNGGPGGSATPGPIDPCSLLTADEASTAVGAKLGAGVGSQLDPDRVCTWKAGTTEVKLILAPPAPDAATAQAYWDAERSQVPAGVNIADVAGFDRAAYGSGAVGGYSVSALFVIKGNTFFDFYCGLRACTEDASVTAANLIVGRLP